MLDAIKFEHTIFALPFAYIAMVLAARGWPGWWTVGWVTAAMVGGRTCAMAANRVIDRFIDAKNPRTAGRHLPSGLLGVSEMRALAIAGAALMFVAAWMLNSLCFALAPLALTFLVGYHYMKRFTWLSHWVLGFTDGIAGAGGWIAVRGAFEPPAFIIWFALTTWIGGFDLIYACQDVAVDRAQGLHSFPARFGVRAALIAARVNHALTALALAALGWQLALGPIYWVGWLAVVALFAYEHSLVSPRDLSRLDVAFFNVNGYIALIVLARTMFTRIARRYDLMNSLMTGGRHHAWRRRVAEGAAGAPTGPVLDLATGTADLALAVRARTPGRFVTGADFSEGMLRVGQAKLRQRHVDRVELLVADALALPFRDGAFACVMSAFLLRNLEDLGRGLAEMRRVTARGGRVITLDIVRPAQPLWGTVFGAYFNHVVPAIGAFVAGDRQAYTYLPQSVDSFVTPDELAELMEDVGLRDVTYRRFGLGTIALHIGIA